MNFRPCVTLIVVYTIYSLLKPLHTVLSVLGKENIITSCLMLNSRRIKTVLIDACLSLDDYYLYVLNYFLNVLCVFIAFEAHLHFIVTVCAWHAALKGYLTWLALVMKYHKNVSGHLIWNSVTRLRSYRCKIGCQQDRRSRANICSCRSLAHWRTPSSTCYIHYFHYIHRHLTHHQNFTAASQSTVVTCDVPQIHRKFTAKYSFKLVTKIKTRSTSLKRTVAR